MPQLTIRTNDFIVVGLDVIAIYANPSTFTLKGQ